MQVLPQDVDSQYGIAQSPIGPSPSQSPLAFQPFGPAPSAPLSAYTSALARSASASGSGNLSRHSKSPTDNKATATATATAPGGAAAVAAAAAEQGDVVPGVAVLGGNPRGAHGEPVGVTPPSEEDGASVRSVTSSTAQTDTWAEEVHAAQPSGQPVSSSSEMQSTASRPAAAPQDPDPVQVQEGSAITAVTSQSTKQQPTDSSQDSAQAAGTDAGIRGAVCCTVSALMIWMRLRPWYGGIPEIRKYGGIPEIRKYDGGS